MTKQDIPRCATCQHWKPDFTNEYGSCDILFCDIDFDLHDDSGEAYVRNVETPADFSCINHSELKENETEN